MNDCLERMNHQAAYAHGTAPCTREQFYAMACDPRRHVVVQACAGAGKTWMLVSRIVRALVEMKLRSETEAVPFEPHNILAITFTKKAAGEMRERLMLWLEQWHQAGQAGDDETLNRALVERGLLPTSQLRSVLSNLYRTLLDNPRSVQLRTFHSWFAALVRGAPLAVLERLGLPATYELLEDDTQAMALVWPDFYRQLAGDGALRAIYDEAVATMGRYSTEQALTNALARRVEFVLADAQGVVVRSVPTMHEAYAEFSGCAHPHDFMQKKGVRAVLYDAAKSLAQSQAVSFSAKGAALEQALSQGDGAAVIAALLTLEGKPRQFGKNLPDLDSVARAQDVAMRMHEAAEQHEAWQHQQRMAQLTRSLIGCFKRVKAERGWVDMGDLETTSLTLLSDPVLAGWVQQRLDANIRHLLIDEFQDTNPLQWQALHAWLSGYAGAGGGQEAPRVFIVGDAKQSIYRFRRAEPQVFEAAIDFVTQGLGGDVLSCDHTRRNSQAVLAAVNAVMKPAAQALESELGQAYDFRDHTTESTGLDGQVLALPWIARIDKESVEPAAQWRDTLSTPRDIPEERQIDRECAQAAIWIAERVAQGVATRDIMVLARKRSRLAALSEALRQRNIACEIAEQSALIDHAAIQDVVALVEAALSPIDDLALARALRSPLLGWQDEQLAWLASCVLKQPDSWWNTLFSLSKEEQPTQSGCGLCSDFVHKTVTILRSVQDWFTRLPPHDALVRLYAACNVPHCMMAAAPAAMREAMRLQLAALLKSALEVDGARLLTPQAWVHALRSGHVDAPSLSASGQAVRLLTVHGAKGLEARCVLLLDADATAEKSRTLDVLVDWPGQSQAPVLFAYLRSESKVPRMLRAAVAHERTARAREELNALYVAMTRAKQVLAFSAHEVRLPDPRSPWARLQIAAQQQPSVIQALETVACLDQEQPHLPEPGFTLHVLPVAPTDQYQPSIAPSTTDTRDTRAALIGQAMHRLLERYRSSASGGAGLHAASSVQREFGLTPHEALLAHERASAITQGEARWVWSDAHIDWYANEAELRHAGALLRIDRLVREQATKTWWILDYKSALQPEKQKELREQLAQYKQALQAAHPNEPIRMAFINAEGKVIEVTSLDPGTDSTVRAAWFPT